MINLSFTPKPRALIKASFLLIEQQFFLKYTVLLLNLMTGLLISIYLLKLFIQGLIFKEILLFTFSCLWIFLRKPLNLKILKYNTLNHPSLRCKLNIQLSKNGIIWSGKKIKKGQLDWRQVTKIYQTKVEYILPLAGNRVLWIPKYAFNDSELAEFQMLLKHAMIKIKETNLSF